MPDGLLHGSSHEQAQHEQAQPSSQGDLEDERDFLLRSLADLEREHAAGDLDEHDYEELSSDYTARAADVLRRLGAVAAEPNDGSYDASTDAVVPPIATPRRSSTAGRSAAAGPRPARSPWRAPLIGLVVVAVAVGAGIAVARSAGERVGNTGLTGSVRSAAPDATQTKVEALLTEGLQHMADDPVRALKAFESAATLDPTRADAIAYSGWLLRLVGRSATDSAQAKELFTAAKARLDKAISLDPSYPDARAFRAILLLRDENDPISALADFTALDKLDPPAAIKQLVGTAEADAKAGALAVLSGATTTTPGASTAPASTAPASTAPGAATPASPSSTP